MLTRAKANRLLRYAATLATRDPAHAAIFVRMETIARQTEEREAALQRARALTEQSSEAIHAGAPNSRPRHSAAGRPDCGP